MYATLNAIPLTTGLMLDIMSFVFSIFVVPVVNADISAIVNDINSIIKIIHLYIFLYFPFVDMYINIADK